MKALWLGMAAAVIIAVVAGVVLDAVEETSGERFSTSSTRR